jgi:uncharacterized protein YeeX (DUF496 family)
MKKKQKITLSNSDKVNFIKAYIYSSKLDEIEKAKRDIEKTIKTIEFINENTLKFNKLSLSNGIGHCSSTNKTVIKKVITILIKEHSKEIEGYKIQLAALKKEASLIDRTLKRYLNKKTKNVRPKRVKNR